MQGRERSGDYFRSFLLFRFVCLLLVTDIILSSTGIKTDTTGIIFGSTGIRFDPIGIEVFLPVLNIKLGPLLLD